MYAHEKTLLSSQTTGKTLNIRAFTLNGAIEIR